jgi:WD40 repeat protein
MPHRHSIFVVPLQPRVLSRHGLQANRFWVSLLSGLVFLLTGVAIAEEKAPTYEQHVLPIFREKCCGCHNADKKAGGLDLTSYQQMMAGGNSGDVLDAGNPQNSYLWQVVSHDSEPTMPPDADRIPEAMLSVITKWIAGGILERDGAKPVAKKAGSSLALDAGAIVKPEGPPVMPPRLPLEPVSHGLRPTTILALAASPHGDFAALGGRQQVLLVGAGSRELIGVLPFPEGDCTTLRFSRSARLLLAGGGMAAKSGRVVIWDVSTAQRLMELGDEYDEILAADLSADQRLVALGGPAKVVRLLTTSDGVVESEIRKHTDWITSVAFSPDSVLLATGDRAGNLFLWESFGARHWGDLKGHTSGITGIDWRADGLMLATASEDGTIHLWEADGSKKVKSWAAHGGGASQVRWLADGRLVSTGRDRAVKLWKADGALERQLGVLPDVGTAVTVTSDTAVVIAGDWGGTVEVFQTADGTKLGVIDANPPPLKNRLQAAREQVAAATAAEKAAREADKLAAETEQKAGNALAVATKAVADASADQNAKQAAVLAATMAVTTAKQGLVDAESKVVRDAATIAEAEKLLAAAGDDAAKNAAESKLAAAREADVGSRQAKQSAEKVLESASGVLSTATREHDAAVKRVADLTAKTTPLTAARDQAAAARKAAADGLAKASSDLQTAQKIEARWQDEISFADSVR